MAFEGRSFEDNLKVLQEYAKEKGDSFFIKITRRNNEGDPMPSQWASLDRGTMEHIVNRELWLEDMIPHDVGGVFELTIFHTSERSKPLVMQGFRLIRDSGRNGPPNCAVVGTKDWRGPSVLIYPRAMNKSNEGTVLLSSSPSSQTSVSTQDAVNSSLKGNGNNMDRTASNLLDAASQLEKQRMELAEERHRFELSRVEAKATAELNSVKEMMSRLEKSMSEARHSTPAERAPNIIEQIPALLAAVSPLIATFTAQSAEREKFLASISEKNAERQAQALKELADSLAKKPDATEGKMMLQMSEAMSSITNMTFQAMHQAREVMQAGQQPDQSPWVEVGVKLTDALEKLGTGWMDVLKKRPVIVTDAQQKQLSAGQNVNVAPQPKQAPPAPPVRSVATPTGGVPAAQTTFAVNSEPTTQPANVLNFPAQAAKLSYDNILHPVDKLEAMIRNNEPPKAVVDYFFTNLHAPEMQHELAQVNGEPTDLFLSRVGVDWIQIEANKNYAIEIGKELVDEAKRRGMLSEEEDDEEETSGTNVEEASTEDVTAAKPEATNE